MMDVVRLRALLGGADTAWLIRRVRQRLEAGGNLDGAVTLQNPTSGEREAVARLFGRRAGGGTAVSVRLPALDAMLRRAELCDGLAEAVTRLSGPIVNLRARRDEIETRWSEVFDGAFRRIGSRPALGGWLDEIRATGLLRRLSRGNARTGQALIEQSLAVADRLPAAGIPLAELAASVTGDSHALDLGRPVGTLVVRFAIALAGGCIRDDRRRRDVWADVGVLCDELSAPVLVLNLRAGGSTPVARCLAMHADNGEPYRLSTRQLLRRPPDFSPTLSGRTVYVCENVSVVASAANHLGSQSAPLVCVDGQVKTAARLLLKQLAVGGARLLYHGDFDWGGVCIANVVISQCGALPWRYSTADYRIAPAGKRLSGNAAPTPWDPELGSAMRASGHAVYEEQVISGLLADLASNGGEAHERQSQFHNSQHRELDAEMPRAAPDECGS